MKQSTIILLLLCLAIIGCKKEKQEECFLIEGKWKIIQTGTSTTNNIFYFIFDRQKDSLYTSINNNGIIIEVDKLKLESDCNTFIYKDKSYYLKPNAAKDSIYTYIKYAEFESLEFILYKTN